MPDSTITLKTRADLSALVAARNSFNVLSSEEQKAERQALSLARSMAALDAKLGQPAAGALRLRAALQHAAYLDPSQATGALSQIISLEQKAATEADKAARAIKGLGTNNGLQVLPRSLAGLSGGAADVAKGFLTLQALERGFQFIKTGAEVADVTTSFTNLSKAAGTTGTALLGSLREASNSTITDAALIKSANLGLLLTQGRIAKDLPALTRIAQAAAKATGQSVDFVFESLVKGISRGSAKIIDNAGITLDGEKAYAVYAASIGKTADQLTKAEQQQAVLNAVVLEGNQIVKDAGINADDASVKIAAAQTAVQNLLTALATKAAPVAGSIAGGITNLINTGGVAPGAVDTGNAVNANLVGKGQDYQAYANSVNAANDQLQASIGGVAGWYARLRLGLDALTPGQFAYAQSLIATGISSDQAFSKARALADVSNAYADALRNSTDTAIANRAELTALAPTIFEVASQSEHNKIAVDGLLESYAAGTTTLPGLIEALGSLSASNAIATQAAQAEERETRRLGISFLDLIPQANAAAAAIAGIGGAGALLPENRHIGGVGNTAGGVFSHIGGGAGGLSAKQDAEHQALQSSRDNLALSTAKTNAQKIAIYQRQLDKQTTEEGRNRIQAQINGIRNSSARSSGASSGGKGLGALDKVDIALAGDYQAQLDAVNAKLAKGHLTELQRKQLLKERLDLEKKISDEQEKQNNAALDAKIAEIENRKKDREDSKRLSAAQAVLANPNNFSAEQKTNAQDLVELLPLEQQKRNNDVAAKAREAGIAVPTGTTTATANPFVAGAAQPQAGAPTAPAPAQAQGTPLIINMDGKQVAIVQLPFIVEGLKSYTAQTRAAGG